MFFFLLGPTQEKSSCYNDLGMAISNFWLRNRRVIFLVIVFLLPAVPLFLLRIELPRVHVYDTLASWVVHPIAEGINSIKDGADHVWDGYISLVNAKKESAELLRQNQDLASRLSDLEILSSENERLRKLLAMPEIEKGPRIAGKIVGQDSTPESISFIINVGSDHGIVPRLPVVSYEGVVGTISKVYSKSSVFVSIIDPAHDMDGTITRSKARFIVEGSGRKGLSGRLKFLDRAEDVRVGDEVVASGMDGIFPKGIKIGTLVKVDRPRTGVLQEAELRPAVDFGKIEEVLVILPPAKGPIGPMETSLNMDPGALSK